MTDQPTFAARWSDRKKAVLEEAEAAAVVDVIEEEQVDEVPEQTEAELLVELGLKDPDEMEAGDDFSAFMSKAIPTKLKNRALRKLWLSNPALANLDQLLDYGEDYTIDPTAAVEKIASAYKVGKGYMDKWAAEEEAEEAARAEAEANAIPESLIEETAAEEELEVSSDVVFESEPVDQDVQDVVEVDVDVAQPIVEPMLLRRKRMQFTFE